MGSFNGHLLPGALLSILATSWALGAWRVYILSRLSRRRHLFTGSASLPKLPKILWIEGLGKVVCASIGVAAEIATAFVDGRFTGAGTTTQHTSMYIFYGLSGVTDLLTTAGAPMPRGTRHSILLMAVCVEGLVFHFHLHGRTDIDVMVHTLLIYAIAAEAACIAVEMALRHSVLAALGKSYFGVVQGTWFFQIGFILYNPMPNARQWEENHQNLMLVTTIYTWHMIGVLAYVGLMGLVVWLWCTRFEGMGKNEDVCYSLVSNAPIEMKSGGVDETKPGHRTESDDDIFS